MNSAFLNAQPRMELCSCSLTHLHVYFPLIQRLWFVTVCTEGQNSAKLFIHNYRMFSVVKIYLKVQSY